MTWSGAGAGGAEGVARLSRCSNVRKANTLQPVCKYFQRPYYTQQEPGRSLIITFFCQQSRFSTIRTIFTFNSAAEI